MHGLTVQEEEEEEYTWLDNDVALKVDAETGAKSQQSAPPPPPPPPPSAAPATASAAATDADDDDDMLYIYANFKSNRAMISLCDEDEYEFEEANFSAAS